jgi:hypothetical protein
MPAEIKFEVVGDYQKSVEAQLKDMQAALDKQKAELKNNVPARDYIDGLNIIRAECNKLFADCKKITPLHDDMFAYIGAINAAAKNPNAAPVEGSLMGKWNACVATFAPINNFVGVQVKSGKYNIPLLTDAVKNELRKTSSPEMMSLVEQYHKQAVEYRDGVKNLYAKVFSNHKKLHDGIKNLAAKVQASAEVHPLPQRPVLSSSYEAKSQNSANQAQAANARSQAQPSQPSNRDQGAKK